MQEPVELLLKVGSPEDDPEEIDLLTRELLRDLRDLSSVEEAELVGEGAAPPGTKGLDAESVLVLMKISAAALEIVLTMINKRLGHRKGTVSIPTASTPQAGTVRLEGDPAELAKMIASMMSANANTGSAPKPA